MRKKKKLVLFLNACVFPFYSKLTFLVNQYWSVEQGYFSQNYAIH